MKKIILALAMVLGLGMFVSCVQNVDVSQNSYVYEATGKMSFTVDSYDPITSQKVKVTKDVTPTKAYISWSTAGKSNYDTYHVEIFYSYQQDDQTHTGNADFWITKIGKDYYYDDNKVDIATLEGKNITLNFMAGDTKVEVTLNQK